jgi:hypothetical protein
MNDQRKGRLKLLFLVLIFALPVGIGWMLYATDWHPGGKSHGELVQPPRVLEIPVLQTARHKPFDAQSWGSGWHMVYVSKGACADDCRNVLHKMRQLHVSLAKEIGRMQRVWLVNDLLPPEQLSQLQDQYPDLVILQNASILSAQFDLPGVPGASSGRIYLVDPLGQLMMNYPRDAEPSGIHKDLMRLLTYSWTG